MIRVLILSGTGSCCFGISGDGRTQKVGGWGHLLGDAGSGYDISLRALRSVIHEYDTTGRWPALGTRFLRALLLNEPEQLVGWIQSASKPDIAALAVEVFAASGQRDLIAARILADTAQRLASDAVACARRLGPEKAPAQFVLAGSVLLKQPAFAAKLGALLKRLRHGTVVTPLQREGAWGAVELAKALFLSHPQGAAAAGSGGGGQRHPPHLQAEAPDDPYQLQHWTSDLARTSPTEQRNPRSMNLDRMSIAAAIELMLSEDEHIPEAIRHQKKHLERAVQWIAAAFKRGGRLFYVGAGTSGRLGVLDASECPPTFSVPPEMVQGIMAGGQSALWRSVEGAEDDARGGASAIEHRGVTRRDVVVGIAASGRTPFVWGALQAAKARGAKTVLLCCNPNLNIPRNQRPGLMIVLNTGPEVLTGSTRLKAGTATKLVLNVLTTLAMVRIGKVASNLMVDLNPSNTKLRDRAVRIIRTLAGADENQARDALGKSGWVIKQALRRLRTLRAP